MLETVRMWWNTLYGGFGRWWSATKTGTKSTANSCCATRYYWWDLIVPHHMVCIMWFQHVPQFIWAVEVKLFHILFTIDYTYLRYKHHEWNQSLILFHYAFMISSSRPWGAFVYHPNWVDLAVHLKFWRLWSSHGASWVEHNRCVVPSTFDAWHLALPSCLHLETNFYMEGGLFFRLQNGYQN